MGKGRQANEEYGSQKLTSNSLTLVQERYLSLEYKSFLA